MISPIALEAGRSLIDLDHKTDSDAHRVNALRRAQPAFHRMSGRAQFFGRVSVRLGAHVLARFEAVHDDPTDVCHELVRGLGAAGPLDIELEIAQRPLTAVRI